MPISLQDVTLFDVTLESTYAPPTAYSGALSVGSTTSPWIHVYSFTFDGGFISKYANPSTLMNGFSRQQSFNNTNTVIAASNDNNPTMNAYAFDIVTGFGTKYANPATLRGLLVGASFHPNGNFIGIAGDGNLVGAYAWNNTTGFGSLTTAPSVSGTSWEPAWNSGGTVITVPNTTGSAPQFGTWPFNTSTGAFGTKFTNPGSFISSANYQDADFHPEDTAVCYAAGAAAPGVLAYAWNNSTGYGSRYSDPASAPAAGVFTSQFTPSGAVIAFIGSNTAFFYLWNSGTGFGTRFSSPSSALTATSDKLRFSPTNDLVAITTSGSPFIQVYKWNDSTGFGTKYANPSTLPSSAGSFPTWAKII
jgi:hypothetical protein